MENCIFCRLIKGEIPSKKVYEDDKIFAFLDVNPITQGHLLVVPKKHFVNIFDTPNDILGRINVTCKKMALLLKEKLGVSGVNIHSSSGSVAQQEVMHLHYHVIPRYKGGDFKIIFDNKSHNIKNLNEVFEKLKK